jgi:hypothetical protein
MNLTIINNSNNNLIQNPYLNLVLDNFYEINKTVLAIY